MTTETNPLADPTSWNLMADDYLAEVVPHFERYAADAIRLAAPSVSARIADVACGPGTLAMLAAASFAEVCALDFSTEMVERLRERAKRAGVRNLRVEVGDGQALPWPDGQFDAAFSLFGLFLFTDRARGLLELRRVLRSSGVAVISSWVAAERPPIIKIIRKALQKYVPGMPDAEQSPLGTEDLLRAEMGTAGFHDVVIEKVVHPQEFASLDEAWLSMRRALLPVVLLRRRLPEPEYAKVEYDVRALLESELGRGPQIVNLPAWLARGAA